MTTISTNHSTNNGDKSSKNPGWNVVLNVTTSLQDVSPNNFIFMNTETDCAYKLQSIYFLKFATTHPLRQFCERPRFLTTPNMLIEKVVTLRRHRQLRFWPFEAFSKSVRRSTTQRLAIGCKSSHTTFVCSTHTCVERQNVGSLRLRRASRDAR